MKTRYEVSAAFLYFLSGTIAGVGTNIVTGVITGSARSFDSIVVVFGGFGVVAVSYALFRLAAVYDHYEKLFDRSVPESLTEHERDAIWERLSSKRLEEVGKFRAPLLIAGIGLVVLFVIREIVIAST